MSKLLKGFITYSHEDTEQKDELRKRLAVMEQQNELVPWDDGQLTPGDKALQEDILKEVADSDLLLYLVSAASLASENCKKELEEASKRNIRVISILLEYCDWKHHQLSGFEVLPYKGKPLTKWKDKTEGWQNVVDGIRSAVEKIKSQADSSSETSEKELHAELAFQHGNVQMLLGQLDIAAKSYSDAVKFTLRHANAIKAYSDAIELNPRHVNAYNNRGVIFSIKDEHDRAIKDYTKAIEIKPDYARSYSNRGVSYNKTGEVDCAIKDLNKAIENSPLIMPLIITIVGLLTSSKVR